MRQGLIETKLAKGLAVGGLTALGLLSITGCGNEQPTAQTTHKATSNPVSAINPNSAKLNMALDLCANEAINSTIKEVTHMALTCVKLPGSHKGASSKEEEVEEYAWYDATTSKTIINAVLQYYPGNDELFYVVDKSVGGKDEPVGSTPCVLKRNNDLKINGYDCFLSEHYYTSITDANGLQYPASAYQSIARRLIVEASK